MTPWWAPATAGYIGAAVGIAGALFGTIAGVGTSRLRTPAHFAAMRTFFLAFIAIGLAALATGIYALIAKQPYHVWYPFLLGGFILTILPAALLPVLKNRMRMVEHRRLESESIRQS